MAVCLATGLAPARGSAEQPATSVWSFASWPQAPWFACLLLALLLLLARRGIFAQASERPTAPARLTLAALTLASSAAFLLLIDHSMSGDFRRVLSDVMRGVWLLKAEPLGPTTFQLLFRLTRALDLPPLSGMQWMLALLCTPWVALLWLLAGPAAPDRWARLAVLLSSASLALCFGHIETYTLPALFMLGYMAQAEATVRSGLRFPACCALFAVACAFHMQMLCLGPSLLLCGWRSARLTGVRIAVFRLCAYALAPVLTVQVLCLLHPPPYLQFYGGGDGRMLIQPSQLLHPHYWFGVLNLLLLYAPALLPLLVLARRVRRSALPRSDEPSTPSLDLARYHPPLLASSWLAFVLLWNPDLGYFHDWDLFAAAGIPLNFGALWLVDSSVAPAERRVALCAMVTLNLLRTIPFVLDNHHLVL